MDRTPKTRRDSIISETRTIVASFEDTARKTAARLGITDEHMLDYATLELTKRYIERHVRRDSSEFP